MDKKQMATVMSPFAHVREAMMQKQYSVFINAGALVVLPAQMSIQEKQDVQHSLLFAQLAATKRYPLTSEYGEWYSIWQQVLKDTWLQQSVTWDKFTPQPGASVAPVDCLVEQLGNGLQSHEVAECSAILQYIAGLPPTDPVVGFLRERVQRRKEPGDEEVAAIDQFHFLVVVAQPGLRLNAAYLMLSASAGDTGNPFARVFNADNVAGVIEQRFFQADLVTALHKPVRAALGKRLEPFAELIREVPEAVAL
ncbi:hypothetical protein [Pseudomonas botevensis]|uniref:hypothetical protein n=1 Tax=Pseudomonas botevensis TaxID=2842352 RepID=UPI001C3D140A|nr:hypothetical protein [Pseudomonas botevensis]MBV4477989.1 hypothetical protein [Pseudomonas botevensis]